MKGIDLGLEEYDFGGVGIESIDKFKQSFGGVYVEHHRWVFCNKLLRLGFGVVRFLKEKGWLKIHS